MAWRPTSRARVNPTKPRAWATCDRCGFLYNITDLKWQFDWRGFQLQNIRLLVCTPCLDIPTPAYRSIVLPPDPPGILNARPEPYPVDEAPSTRVTQDNRIRIAINYPRNSQRVTTGSQ